MHKNTVHLIIRFSDNLFSVGNVIDKHNQIVSMHGFVWFGKLGQVISQTRMDILKSQITSSTPTYVFLVKGNRQQSTFYKANLLGISKELPRKDMKFIPDYYKEFNLLKYITTWIMISETISIEPSIMSKFKAVNSVFPILETLARSSSGYFLIHESKNIF